MTKLEACNTCLIALGLQPVNSLDSPVGDILTALMYIDRVTTEILTDGLPCNYEEKTLEPDSEGFIVLPSNTLNVITGNKLYVQRGMRLYNSSEGTYEFTEKVPCVLFIQLDFEELPQIVQNYIAIKSARGLVKTLDGDIERTQLFTEDWYQAVGDLKRYKVQAYIPNMLLDNLSSGNTINRRRYYYGY
jgi:hypothetical protein